MDKRTTTAGSTRELTKDQLTLVSGGARFNPQPDPPGARFNPQPDPPGLVPHNPPTY